MQIIAKGMIIMDFPANCQKGTPVVVTSSMRFRRLLVWRVCCWGITSVNPKGSCLESAALSGSLYLKDLYTAIHSPANKLWPHLGVRNRCKRPSSH